jgi:hypothetical protein
MARYNPETDIGARYDDGIEITDDGFSPDFGAIVRAPSSVGSSDVADQVTFDAFTVDQNDLSLPEGSSFRLSTDGVAARTVTGFANVRAARVVFIHNVAGAQNILIAHQSASSAAENRIITRAAATLTIGPDQSAAFQYDSITTRWRQICP